MTLRLTAQTAGVVEDAEVDLFSVGIAEYPDGTGWSLVFQGGPMDHSDSDPDDEPGTPARRIGSGVRRDNGVQPPESAGTSRLNASHPGPAPLSRAAGARPQARNASEYKVVGSRGALVDVEVVGQRGTKRKGQIAQFLAGMLGVPTDDHVGCRYGCLVTPDRYGETRSDFKLVGD